MGGLRRQGPGLILASCSAWTGVGIMARLTQLEDVVFPVKEHPVFASVDTGFGIEGRDY